MLIAIAIVAKNGVLGDGNTQPFSFPEDWRHFKDATLGHPMIMGRKTYQAMGERLLPGRTTIVVTRHPEQVRFPEASASTASNTRGLAVSTPDEALAIAREIDETVYVCGGGEIYRYFLPLTDLLDLTEVHAEADGSVFFPAIDPDQWREVSRDPRPEFDFVRYARISDPTRP